ncbi:hypothetical protein Leryth_000557 [Lithospermum erythrorhizon]|uniref:Uncharacterized protein n=1 Tax=Lithospermum erythrorhizon TaxID=34254 RepID=A0AAV3QIK7_LITER|nr:hypothetical protein Leryth_000557 [Lithospermum erythrorhizon]
MKLSSSSNHTYTENEATKPIPNCLILLPFFSSPPFNNNIIKQSSNVVSKPNFQLLTTATSKAFSNVQHSIAYTAEKWFSEIYSFASKNLIFQKFVCFQSYIQEQVQISFRQRTNLDNLSHHNFAAILPGDAVAGIVAANGISNFLNIYNTLLVVRLVLTWFPNAPPAVVSPLSTLCDPYLNIFRGLIPPLGGTLDLSPILAFIVLNAFTSTASALPAELPSAGEHADGQLQTPATATQKKWMKRLAAKQKTSSSEN